MQNTELSPELADAADVLSDQLKVHLRRLSEFLAPHSMGLERKFVSRLRVLKYDKKQRVALAAITLGAAAKIFAENEPPLKFIEQVEYHGRRLAKMNLPPSAILTALEEYDFLLTPIVRDRFPTEYPHLQWVREQLHFCVILTLNNAYYQVREAETQAFYQLFRSELEAQNLEQLLQRFIGTMVSICTADAGHLYLLNSQTGAWEWKAGANGKRPKQIAAVSEALRRRLSVPR